MKDQFLLSPDTKQSLFQQAPSCMVYIGRFQPLHNSHTEIICRALTEADSLVMVIGSAFMARNIRNPFTIEERKDLISCWLQAFDPSLQKRVKFVFLRDFYDLAQWSHTLVRKVQSIVYEGTKIHLIGHFKDESSLYLKCFPFWQFVEIENINHLSATRVRDLWFEEDSSYQNLVPAQVSDFLQQFSQTTDFKRLQKEYFLLKSSRRVVFPNKVICLYAKEQVLLQKDPKTEELFLPSFDDLPIADLLQKTEIIRTVHLQRSDLPFTETIFWELNRNFNSLLFARKISGFVVIKKKELSDLEENFREGHFMVIEKFLQILSKEN